MVGQQVATLLAGDADFSVSLLNRRPLELISDDLESNNIEQYIVDFDSLEASKDLFKGDVLVCTLGTTIKKAGSESAFRRVDYDYVVNLAQLAAENDVKHFIVISAVGTDKNSKVFYSKTKGEMEEAVKSLGFDSVSILRPSLLVGERSEFRFGEHLGIWLTKPIAWLIPKLYRPIPATQVAAKIVSLCGDSNPGHHIIQGHKLWQ